MSDQNMANSIHDLILNVFNRMDQATQRIEQKCERIGDGVHNCNVSIATIESSVKQIQTHTDNCHTKIEEINTRVGTLEKFKWQAVGLITGIGAIINLAFMGLRMFFEK